MRCAAGAQPVETSVADVRIQVLFDTRVCDACPRKRECPAAAVGRRDRRWQYNHDRVHQRERRLKDASEEFRGQYRWRAGVEATMSRLKHQMGMAKLRIRGMANVTYVATLRALGLNIRRVAAYRPAAGSARAPALPPRPSSNRPPSRGLHATDVGRVLPAITPPCAAASSRLASWQLTPGTSSIQPIHVPACSFTTAVYV